MNGLDSTESNKTHGINHVKIVLQHPLLNSVNMASQTSTIVTPPTSPSHQAFTPPNMDLVLTISNTVLADDDEKSSGGEEEIEGMIEMGNSSI